MGTLEPQRKPDWVRFLTLLVALGVMAVVLAALLAVVLSGADRAGLDEKQKRALVRLAVVCVAMLGLTVVIMFWLALRFIGARFRNTPQHPPTEHVDAWRLAGQRARAPGAHQEEGDGPQAGDKDRPPT